jgi:hypothetical protein
MRDFRNSQEIYETLGALIAELGAAELVGSPLRQLDQTIRLDLRDPAATITARCRRDDSAEVEFGESAAVPDLEISASARAAHRLFLGELNIFLATDRGEMALTGSSTDFLLSLPEIARTAGPYYRRLLQSRGLAALLEGDHDG